MPRPERIFKTDAIILRRHEFGEADRLLTVFTPDYGKLRAIAKGARRLNGRKTGHVELYTRAAMLIARGRELHVVSQAELIEPYLLLREDLQRGAYASYVVELVDYFSEFEEQNTLLYHLLDATLTRLADPRSNLQLVARYYELELLRLVGFQPSLFHCAIGQEDVEPREQYHFGLIEGGIICAEHIAGSRNLLPVSFNALKTLRFLQTRDYEVIKSLRLESGLRLELERLLQNYIIHLLEQRLKSIDFIRRLRRSDLLD